MIRLLLLCLVATIAAAVEVPAWVYRGILTVESRSYYDEQDRIVWVDRRRGNAGERGPAQMTRTAWRQVRRPGETFAALETDMDYAEQCMLRYLDWLWSKQSHPTWETTVQWYNAGPNHRSPTYLRLVRHAGE